AKASVSGPLVDDRLAIRISSAVTSRGGTIDNVRTGEDLHKQRTSSFRGQLLWKVNDDVDLTFAGDWNLQNPLCCVQY
ncbi:hypothetical protein, partial [Escherichia coli]